jgi:hypothetical protein
MPSTSHGITISVYSGNTLVATSSSASIHLHDWCVQVRCTLDTGGSQLDHDTAYRIVRSDGGGNLDPMYCDEKPAVTNPTGNLPGIQFVSGGVYRGVARFSNRKTVDNRTWPVLAWTFGKAPGTHAPGGGGASKVDKSKLSFDPDQL